MRALDIWIFIFIVNLCVSLVSQFGIFDPMNSLAVKGVNPELYANSTFEQMTKGVNATQPTAGWLSETLSYMNVAFRFVIVLVPKLLVSLIDATILFPMMLTNVFHIPVPLAWGVLAPMYYILMGIAIFQIATGRSTREAE